MNRTSILCLCVPIATGVLLFFACNNHPSTGATPSSRLPQDVDSLCGISTDSFNTWFLSGQAAADGVVTPANSVRFPHNDNCDFYQWAERMFLWVTSPDTAGYGGRGRVLGSPRFYTVVSRGDSFYLKPHNHNDLIEAVSVLRKTGPNRLPVYSDHLGRLYEVLSHKPGEIPLLKDGKAVLTPTRLIHPERVLHAFKTPTGTRYFDSNGVPVNTELNQATGDALMAQNGSLVYYITFVNDMYAFFRTGVSHNALPDTTFPTSGAQRDAIVAYARSIGYPPPSNPNTLAIEIKTSWILADSLHGDANKYITMDALVPTYIKNSDTSWIPFQHQKVRLALVGIHIVGSAAGHPEMIWATFEHNGNTPDSAYRYEDSQYQIQTVPTDNTGPWLFSSAAGAPFNQTHIKASSTGDTLTAAPPYTISASNTLRDFPFGVDFGRKPNQQDSTDAQSNSELIGINNSVFNKIPGKDVRKNYHLIGATWTSGGVAPNGYVYVYPDTVEPGVAIGTSVLANSTMETYFQATNYSCLTCHSGPGTLQPDKLSHIFTNMGPLYILHK